MIQKKKFRTDFLFVMPCASMRSFSAITLPSRDPSAITVIPAFASPSLTRATVAGVTACGFTKRNAWFLVAVTEPFVPAMARALSRQSLGPAPCFWGCATLQSEPSGGGIPKHFGLHSMGRGIPWCNKLPTTCQCSWKNRPAFLQRGSPLKGPAWWH